MSEYDESNMVWYYRGKDADTGHLATVQDDTMLMIVNLANGDVLDLSSGIVDRTGSPESAETE